MPVARIALAFWTHPKRLKLERLLASHPWGSAKHGDPQSGGECVARILAWLDGLGDPEGTITSRDDLEMVAGWRGQDGGLWSALVESGFVDQDPDRWHDFGDLNGKALNLRESASVAGKASAAARKAKFGTAQPQKPERPERNPERRSTPPFERAPNSSGSGSDQDQDQDQEGATRLARARPKPGPQDLAARDLATRLGSSLNPCRKQVQALLASGWDLDRVRAAIEQHATPGMAPWDWTKEARGEVNGRASSHWKGGLSPQDIIDMTRARPAPSRPQGAIDVEFSE